MNVCAPAQLKCSEKRNIFRVVLFVCFLKEESVVECLTSLGKLFKMRGLKWDKERKPLSLRMKRQSLSMRVSDEERKERQGLQSCSSSKR